MGRAKGPEGLAERIGARTFVLFLPDKSRTNTPQVLAGPLLAALAAHVAPRQKLTSGRSSRARFVIVISLYIKINKTKDGRGKETND